MLKLPERFFNLQTSRWQTSDAHLNLQSVNAIIDITKPEQMMELTRYIKHIFLTKIQSTQNVVEVLVASVQRRIRKTKYLHKREASS